MTDKAPTFIQPETIYSEAFQSAVNAYERTKNIQASADATAETILERFGFPSVFAILAMKMASNWWRLKLTGEITIERLLTNVLSALIAHELADSQGLDIGDPDSLNGQQRTTQGVSGADSGKDEVKRKGTKVKLQKPKPVS